MFIQVFFDGRAAVQVLAIPHIVLYGLSREAVINGVYDGEIDAFLLATIRRTATTSSPE